ncbi:MAG: hypothetical protein WCI05_12675 [Myxococcales bacterium]
MGTDEAAGVALGDSPWAWAYTWAVRLGGAGDADGSSGAARGTRGTSKELETAEVTAAIGAVSALSELVGVVEADRAAVRGGGSGATAGVEVAVPAAGGLGGGTAFRAAGGCGLFWDTLSAAGIGTIRSAGEAGRTESTWDTCFVGGAAVFGAALVGGTGSCETSTAAELAFGAVGGVVAVQDEVVHVPVEGFIGKGETTSGVGPFLNIAEVVAHVAAGGAAGDGGAAWSCGGGRRRRGEDGGSRVVWARGVVAADGEPMA